VVCEGDELLRDDGLTATALRSAAIEAAESKRWLASGQRGSPARSRRTLYADLSRQSKWNAERTDPLRADTLLWLPPLRRLGRLDRPRLSRVALDPTPRPAGSSKLAPLGDSTPQWTNVDDDYGRDVTYAPFHRFARSA
jgi:hypothetical protein